MPEQHFLTVFCVLLLVQVDPNAPKSGKAKKVSAVADKKGGLNPFAVALLLIAIAVGVYFSQMK